MNNFYSYKLQLQLQLQTNKATKQHEEHQMVEQEVVPSARVSFQTPRAWFRGVQPDAVPYGDGYRHVMAATERCQQETCVRFSSRLVEADVSCEDARACPEQPAVPGHGISSPYEGCQGVVPGGSGEE